MSDKAAERLLFAARAPRAPRRSASTFTIVASPSASDVPKGPVTGWANGRAFTGRTIWFEPERDHWTLTVADAEGKKVAWLAPSSYYVERSRSGTPSR